MITAVLATDSGPAIASHKLQTNLPAIHSFHLQALKKSKRRPYLRKKVLSVPVNTTLFRAGRVCCHVQVGLVVPLFRHMK
jgi:hypothetical protein